MGGAGQTTAEFRIDMLQPWKTLSTRKVGDFKVFSMRADLKVSPRTGEEYEFYILESVDWVNVIATTANNELVMLEQYRHGSGTLELEIPGGMMDPHESDPVEAGVRELREETGYEGVEARQIGKIFANPAILNNTCYTVLVENCELKHAVSLDSGEDCATKLVPIAQIPGLVREGRIGHSLVAVALFHYQLLQDK